MTEFRPQLEGEARILPGEGFRQRALADPADAAHGGDGYRVRVVEGAIERRQFVAAPDEAIRRRDVVTGRGVGSRWASIEFDFDPLHARENFVRLFARCQSRKRVEDRLVLQINVADKLKELTVEFIGGQKRGDLLGVNAVL